MPRDNANIFAIILSGRKLQKSRILGACTKKVHFYLFFRLSCRTFAPHLQKMLLL
jgi:hypothetical protein